MPMTLAERGEVRRDIHDAASMGTSKAGNSREWEQDDSSSNAPIVNPIGTHVPGTEGIKVSGQSQA